MPTEPCADLAAVSREQRHALLRLVLLQRLFEERALALYRQGRISGSFYDGRGQEAVAAAAGLALGPDDVVAPLNRELACHFSRGVTPADVHCDRKEEKQRQVREYREAEQGRRDVAPWQRSYWQILKSGLGLKDMANGELLTKLAFFGRKPLRRIAQRNRECVG